MCLLSDVFVKIIINDHSFNMCSSWCYVYFILVDLIVFSFFFLFFYWAKPLKANVIIILLKTDLLSNGTLKIGCVETPQKVTECEKTKTVIGNETEILITLTKYNSCQQCEEGNRC